MKMTLDGNFVIYNRQNQPKWSTGTYGNPGAFLVLQDDGNLVVYDSHQNAKWSANTKSKKQMQLNMKQIKKIF